MISRYRNFIKGVSVHPIGKLGVVLATSGFVTMVMFLLVQFAGGITNTYVGLITFLGLPAIFLTGLILIPIGWMKYKKERGMSTRELLAESFPREDVEASVFGAHLVRTLIILTLVNIVFLSVVGFQTLHFMDSAEFCGTACHEVMNPEWVTYQNSPHARVQCVECHVGEGAAALINSKLNGARQMVLAMFNSYSRPVPTPVHQLRPSRETCEKCHWPSKFYGTRMKTIVHFDQDSASTPKYTTLALKIDGKQPHVKSGIHWHINEENKITYTSVNDQRKEIISVEVSQKDGSVKRFQNRKLRGMDFPVSETRVMDCVDCHNRATHIYQTPEEALDELLSKTDFRQKIPYAKKSGLAAILPFYSDTTRIRDKVYRSLTRFYSKKYPYEYNRIRAALDKYARALATVYKRNVHPHMNIRWGTYPSMAGHKHNSGCFRCHNENMVDERSQPVPFDCTTCHSILAYGEKDPFKYLKSIDKKDPNRKMHQYLQDEFLNGLKTVR